VIGNPGVSIRLPQNWLNGPSGKMQRITSRRHRFLFQATFDKAGQHYTDQHYKDVTTWDTC
jgi:hypothetical protein